MKYKEDPDIVGQAIPFMLFLVILELVVGIVKKKNFHDLSDSISSLISGALLILCKLLPSVFLSGIELVAYVEVYNRFKLMDVPHDSYFASFLCFLGVDFAYYWAHRMSHEINTFWSGHVVHHSSNYYNLTTALRQSVVQPYISWMYYMPMALFLPPRLYFFHKGWNVVYQFWIHTQFISTLGPLEWVINTPSHHRVHHGRNRKYIDKNYGGTLIIWDRIFGTFEQEDKNEEVVYGLVHPLEVFDPVWTQIHHLVEGVCQRFYATSGIMNKIQVLVKGPGWAPGKPRLGDLKDIPDIDPNNKVPKSPALPAAVRFYVFLHYVITIWLFFVCIDEHISYPVAASIGVFVVVSYSSISSFLDAKWYAAYLELFRLILFIAAERVLPSLYRKYYTDELPHLPLHIWRNIYIFSALWLVGYSSMFPLKAISSPTKSTK